MPIRHLVLFAFKDEVDQQDVDQVLSRLNTLPGKVPVIRNWAIHSDLGKREGSLPFALVAEFDRMEDVNAYLDHPEHVALVRDVLPLFSTVAEHDHEIV
jgi:hypothetical protein